MARRDEKCLPGNQRNNTCKTRVLSEDTKQVECFGNGHVRQEWPVPPASSWAALCGPGSGIADVDVGECKTNSGNFQD